MSEKPVVLIISGLDPSGGAGITKDILTVKENGCHPVNLVSTLTIQNSMEFHSSFPVDFSHIKQSINILKKEFRVNSIKIGLIPLQDEWMKKLSIVLDSFNCPIVFDPVLKATAQKNDVESIPAPFFELIKKTGMIITPNLKELHIIYRNSFGNEEIPLKNIPEKLVEKYGCSIITTFEGNSNFVEVVTTSKKMKIQIDHIKTERPVHGTGCSFSSAIAASLAKGSSLFNAVEKAAEFVSSKVNERYFFDQKGQYYF